MSTSVKNLYEHSGIPVGPLKIIPVEGCRPLCEEVDRYIVSWRKEYLREKKANGYYTDYAPDTFIVDAKVPRFGSGEAKGELKASVRGDDVFLIVDVCNFSVTYKMNGTINHLSPDDHFQNLKRLIAAIGGKAKRINVIMPFLYESRQHSRTLRESLDAAMALQELVDMGVSNIITFDAHDPRVQNAIPLSGFETIQPAYQFIKTLVSTESDLNISKDTMMIVSPDEGAMSRAVYTANVLGLDAGTFYKRRDYTQSESPIVAQEFLGQSVEGKNVVVIDDMINSGDSAIEVARELKSRKAARIFICTTFGLFTDGLEKFDRAYQEGIIDRVYTTNLIYQIPELAVREWYVSVNMSKYVAHLIDTLNHDESISLLLNPEDKINEMLGL